MVLKSQPTIFTTKPHGWVLEAILSNNLLMFIKKFSYNFLLSEQIL